MDRIPLNKCTLLAVLIMMSTALPFARATTTTTLKDSLTFLEKPVEEIQHMAARQGKIYFLHFSADWVMPCQWMEEHTFADPVLVEFIKKSFLPVKVDVDSPEGTNLKAQYKITALPTILVFSSKGQLLGTKEGAMEAEELKEWLQPYDVPANRTTSIASNNDSDVLSSPRALVNISRPALMPNHTIRPATAVSTSVNSGTQRPVVVAAANTWRAPSYFTVQTGVFSTYENAITKVRRLESTVNREAHFSTLKKPSGKTLYGVYVGRLNNRTEAIALQESLKSQGVDGFVKKIDN